MRAKSGIEASGRLQHSTWDRVWIGASLATMEGEALGEIRDAALAIRNGRIAWLGPRSALESKRWSATTVTQAQGLWVTPGLVECHTHLVYAGDRSDEFAARLRGKTYEEIARAGGGILSTVQATRRASEDELFAQSLPRAAALATEGVTTLEIKSGYGLDLETEAKMLRVARRIGERLGVTVVKTFLGAHALPPEFIDRKDDYVRHVRDDMLPAIAAQRLADAVDVFCERIAFTREQTQSIFERAQELGLPLRLHADQLSDGGGGALAATCGALSADHLEHASDESLKADGGSRRRRRHLAGRLLLLARETGAADRANARARRRHGDIDRLQSRHVADRLAPARDEHGVRVVQDDGCGGIARRDDPCRACARPSPRSRACCEQACAPISRSGGCAILNSYALKSACTGRWRWWSDED